MKNKSVKEVKIHKFLLCACKSQGFAHWQKFLLQSHDREILTFRNSGVRCHVSCVMYQVSCLFFLFNFYSSFFGQIGGASL